MFLFRNKKKKKDSQYPGFISRMFASVLDLMLATVLIIPICNILYGIIYNGMPPSDELRFIIKSAYGNKVAVAESMEYQNFMQIKGYTALLLEQSIQMCALGLFIIFFWIKYQATPGKMLLHMKIVDRKTMQKPTLIQYIIRLFGYALSAIPFGLGIFYILVNKERRAWHRLLSGTIVISTKHLQRK